MSSVMLECLLNGSDDGSAIAMVFDNQQSAREYVEKLRGCQTIKSIRHGSDDNYTITFCNYSTAQLHLRRLSDEVSYYLLRFDHGLYQETRRFRTRRSAVRYVEDYLDHLNCDPDPGENDMGTWTVHDGATDIKFILRVGATALFSDSDNKSAEYRRVLGVPKDPTDRQIRAAYRRKAKEAHPDAGGSTAEFERVQTAYEYLMANLNSDANDGFDIKQVATLPFSSDLYYFLDIAWDEINEKFVDEVAAQVRAEAGGMAAKGFAMALVGVVLTAISYGSASNGGTYVVFTGLIVVGVINFCRAIWYATASRHAAKKVIKQVNRDNTNGLN